MCYADLPKLKALWHDFHDAYDVGLYVVHTSPITSRPIDDVEPYTTHNGRKVRLNICPLMIPAIAAC